MDIIDSASEVEELQRNAALAAHRINRLAVSAVRCSDCDEPLPEARRIAYPGRTMCVDCQSDAERRNRRM
ncbi:TPA: TraR/DksA family transcriptional regulator [Kluyvera ascorbata]|uniref:TraR/DksA family transcriptional regulator n=1 Tax=Kluyvera ascorbata TaxID=51288 RepID=UPI002915B010|nr:TraR/DksA family transcriptional regulator [Kluyvera ascorbata]MDU3912071.1 TraR/DksA family transcriptional regulator [Kluyvera ascorbata]HDG1721660.1 TraR/DksA family transcriptional regulator [Kluyvera ascorbata]